MAEEEDEEESCDEKVDEEMRFVEEGVNGEEILLLTVSWSVLLVHHHLVPLRARHDTCRATLGLYRELASTFRRPVEARRGLHAGVRRRL